jgi:hypothetical protein
MGRRRMEVTAVDHPTHSPDLVLSDFHMFLHLKKHLAGQKFHEDRGKERSPYVVVCAGSGLL